MKKSVRRNITLFPYFNFCRSFFVYSVVIIIYLAKTFGSYGKAMAILTIYTLSQSFTEIPTGIISDKVGRRWTLALSMLMGMLSCVFAAFGVFYQSYFLFVLFAMCDGISAAFFSGTDRALLFESLRELKKKHKYHNAYGRIESISQVSAALAALAGGFIAEKSYLWVFIVTLIVHFIAFIIALFFVEPKSVERSKDNPLKHFKEAAKLLVKNKKLRNISFAKMIFMSGNFTAHVFQPAFFATLIPVWLIGFARALKNITTFLGYWFSGKIIDKFDRVKTLIGSIVGIFVTNLTALFLALPISPFIIACNNALFGIQQTSESSVFQDEFSDKQRATMSSIIALCANILFSGLSIFAGYLADFVGTRGSLILLEFFAVISAFIYYKNLRGVRE